MATKNCYLSIKNGCQDFAVVEQNSNNARYTNLNLNQGLGRTSRVETVHSKGISSYSSNRVNNEPKFFDDKNSSKKQTFTSNLQSKPFESLNLIDCKDATVQKQRQKDDSSLSSSTLSLHIAAYENSIEEATTTTQPTATKITKAFIEPSKFSQYFEIPRQQENETSKPEIMQFKTSQKLLDNTSDKKAPALDGKEIVKDKPFFGGLIKYMKSGPILAMVWEGLDVVRQGRVMLGATNPLQSAPGSIRGDFCIQTGRNICHGSDSVESANREIGHWFKDDELANYNHNAKNLIYE